MDISRIEMVLLGMIASNPGYAYEIDQFINETHMRRWVKIGSASVYQGLERLAGKGLAVSRPERQGRMPTRRRYYITEKGSLALKKASRRILSRTEDHYLDLNLGLFCSRSLEADEIESLLEKRLSDLENKSREIKSHRKIVPAEKIWRQEAIITALIEFCRAEDRILKDTLKKLQKTKENR